MTTTILSSADKEEIFSHQKDNGPFSALAVTAGCLNYMDRLNRKRLDVQADPQARRNAGLRLVSLEQSLVRYITKETPLSYFDADFRQETDQYILLRNIFLKAEAFTFKRHRLRFLLDLLRLYRDDPCQILPERDALRDKWEHELLHNYLLLDMGQKNTEDIGREAISNGYHECDYTLDIEDVWKQPMQAVLRTNFRYVVQSLPYSKAAQATAAYMKQHLQDLAFSRWVVDTKAIEELMHSDLPPVTEDDIQALAASYRIG
ncbi:hypothetical protein [uncultured Megasphaera sp.]|uniref:hypothetical protein n=1 Tax=uncultured Megasphaera sp. TaxID=165188 RepID=UPI00265965A4|nr:hypothetical protein [uncultured Megasphaera sp.]